MDNPTVQRTGRLATLTIPLFFVFLVGFFSGCDSSSNEREPDPGSIDLREEWRVASPGDAGMSAVLLERANARAAAIPRMRSLLVLRKGKLIVERYYGGTTDRTLFDVRSVTKSIVSTLAGIALDRGKIDSLGESIGEYIRSAAEIVPPDVGALTFRHLLTMSGGFEWHETGGDAYGNWISSGDHIQYLLDQPIVDEPGTTFNYNSAAVHLLGVALQNAVGMSLPEFADNYLFGRIGIDRLTWESLPGDYVNAGAGLDLRSRDLARIGQLFLQKGISGGHAIVPESWVAKATSPRYDRLPSFGPLTAVNYGYLWWIEQGQPEPAFMAWGYGGQFIYVVPDLDLVVVTTTHWGGLSADSGSSGIEAQVLDIIVNDVVASAA